MTCNAEEFLKELEATDDAYLRRKLALGYYSTDQQKIAANWLEAQSVNQTRQSAARRAELAETTLFWTRVGSILQAVGLVLVALLAYCSARKDAIRPSAVAGDARFVRLGRRAALAVDPSLPPW